MALPKGKSGQSSSGGPSAIEDGPSSEEGHRWLQMATACPAPASAAAPVLCLLVLTIRAFPEVPLPTPQLTCPHLASHWPKWGHMSTPKPVTA